MHVPFFDLRVLDNDLRSELLEATARVLDHGQLIDGPEVQKFEAMVAEKVGVKHAVGVGSGSSALYLSLKAAGIGAGDEVITTPLTWIITANAISATGATPIFADVLDDYNINPTNVETCITKKTRAIVPMHYAGHMCDMLCLEELAIRHGLVLIEDAAQAFGGTLNGRAAGSFSLVAGFSMNPMKILGAYGEAGVVVTNDDGIASKIRQLRHAGTKKDPKKISINNCFSAELNHKMDALQAALLGVALKYLPKKLNRRNEIANLLKKGLHGIADLQETHPKEKHARYMYPINIKKRNALRKHLHIHNIETKTFYLPLASEAPVYKDINNITCPTAKRLVQSNLVLPSHEKLTDGQVDFMLQSIQDFYAQYSTNN